MDTSFKQKSGNYPSTPVCHAEALPKLAKAFPKQSRDGYSVVGLTYGRV